MASGRPHSATPTDFSVGLPSFPEFIWSDKLRCVDEIFYAVGNHGSSPVWFAFWTSSSTKIAPCWCVDRNSRIKPASQHSRSTPAKFSLAGILLSLSFWVFLSVFSLFLPQQQRSRSSAKTQGDSALLGSGPPLLLPLLRVGMRDHVPAFIGLVRGAVFHAS